MEQVKVYKTKDGQLFHDRPNAETHELMVNIRGLIQSHVKGESFTPTEISRILCKEQDRLFDLLGKYRRTMGSIKAASTRLS